MANRDLLAGLFFLTSGALGLWFGRDLPVGGLSAIGSGFLPLLAYAGLIVIGLLKIVVGLFRPGDTISLFVPRSLFLVTAAFVLFGLFIERFGLIVAIVAMLAAVELAGSHRKSLAGFAALTIGLVTFSVLVFRYLLGIPLEVLPKWI